MIAWALSFDWRCVTAVCFGLVGLFVIAIALRVWYMPLDRRAQVFGPYLTGQGLSLVLRNWALVFIFGALFVAVGVAEGVYFARWNGALSTETANAVGLPVAIFAAWAAGSLAIVTVRLWRGL